MKYSVLLSLSALLVIGSACVWDDPPREVPVMAAANSGILVEEDGCLRITGPSGNGGDAIIWQKDALTIERRGNTVDIYKGEISDGESPIASWRLGDWIRGGGGWISREEEIDEHAGAGFSERCPGPYFLMGMIP